MRNDARGVDSQYPYPGSQHSGLRRAERVRSGTVYNTRVGTCAALGIEASGVITAGKGVGNVHAAWVAWRGGRRGGRGGGKVLATVYLGVVRDSVVGPASPSASNSTSNKHNTLVGTGPASRGILGYGLLGLTLMLLALGRGFLDLVCPQQRALSWRDSFVWISNLMQCPISCGAHTVPVVMLAGSSTAYAATIRTSLVPSHQLSILVQASFARISLFASYFYIYYCRTNQPTTLHTLHTTQQSSPTFFGHFTTPPNNVRRTYQIRSTLPFFGTATQHSPHNGLLINSGAPFSPNWASSTLLSQTTNVLTIISPTDGRPRFQL